MVEPKQVKCSQQFTYVDIDPTFGAASSHDDRRVVSTELFHAYISNVASDF
jgi:hypothetical protein